MVQSAKIHNTVEPAKNEGSSDRMLSHSASRVATGFSLRQLRRMVDLFVCSFLIEIVMCVPNRVGALIATFYV